MIGEFLAQNARYSLCWREYKYVYCMGDVIFIDALLITRNVFGHRHWISDARIDIQRICASINGGAFKQHRHATEITINEMYSANMNVIKGLIMKK